VKRAIALPSLVAVCLGAALAALVAGRAGAEGEARSLTLDDALTLARRSNKSIIVEKARLAQAQTNLDQAWAVLLPTIAAQGKYTRNYTEFSFPTAGGATSMGGATGTGGGMGTAGGMGTGGMAMGKTLLIQPVNQLDAVISFTAPLIVPAAYPGLESVKAGVRSSEATFEVSERDVLFGVAQSFYAAAIADDVLVARHSNIEVARATLDNAKTRFQAGTVTKVDVDRAELALLRAEQLEREAQYARDQSYRTLATLIQLDGPFRAAPPPITAIIPPPANTEMVLKLRPEFRALEMSIHAADEQRKTDALKWSPSLSAFGNARRFNYDNFAFNNYSWAVGVQLDWLIYDGGARDAQRHLAAAQQAEAEARASLLRDSIRDDLLNGRSFLETKLHALDAATRSVTLAQETIELVRTQYEAGSVTQVDLLQAQDGLVGAQEALAQAHFDVAVADLSLRRAAGTFPPR
jgi:outer membrane protein TolC